MKLHLKLIAKEILCIGTILVLALALVQFLGAEWTTTAALAALVYNFRLIDRRCRVQLQQLERAHLSLMQQDLDRALASLHRLPEGLSREVDSIRRGGRSGRIDITLPSDTVTRANSGGENGIH